MLLEQHPARITIAGRPHWVFADGTRLPVISGGSDDPPRRHPAGRPPPPEFRALQTQEEFDRMIGPRLQRGAISSLATTTTRPLLTSSQRSASRTSPTSNASNVNVTRPSSRRQRCRGPQPRARSGQP